MIKTKHNKETEPAFSYITATNFNRSIEIALNGEFNKDAAVQRVQKRIARCPEGKLYISKDRGRFVLFEMEDRKHKYLRKHSERAYSLARKKYLELLLDILKLTKDYRPTAISKRAELIKRLQHFIEKLELAHMDILPVVMTSTQYKWFSSQYRKKKLNSSNIHVTASGIAVRSKSERDIGNAYEYYAIPYHYEEINSIYVFPLVDQLNQSLFQSNKISGNLLHTEYGTCYWNVPSELDWMNSNGSVWKSYNERTGYITMFNDFKSMLADNDIVLHEHEGLCDQFVYRCNASERVFLLQYTKAISYENLIYTFEDDVSNQDVLNKIIENRILPRLWF